jgi:hypothetical protein
MNYFELEGIITEVETKYYGDEGKSFDILYIQADGEDVPLAWFGQHPPAGSRFSARGKLSNNRGFLKLKYDKGASGGAARRPPPTQGPTYTQQRMREDSIAEGRARGAQSNETPDDDLPF